MTKMKYVTQRNALRSAALCFVALAIATLARAQSSVRLVPSDPLTVHVEVTAAVAYRGGEIALSFPRDALGIESVEAGPDYPDQDGDGRPDACIVDCLYVDSDPEVRCAGGNQGPLGGLIVAWLAPDSTALLPRGTYRILTLHLRREAGAEAGACYPLRFADCVGPQAAPGRNIISDAEVRSIALHTEDRSLCQANCQGLLFSAGRTGTCGELTLRLLHSVSDTELAARTVDAIGRSGWDLARAFLHAFDVEPAAGFSVGLLESGLTVCRTSDNPFRIELNGRRLDVERLRGVCGVDVSVRLPACVDGDLDAACDDADTCPTVYNPRQTEPGRCDAGGECLLLKGDPLEPFLCGTVVVEVREADGETPIGAGRKTVRIAADATTADALRAIARPFVEDGPDGFEVLPGYGEILFCRTGGTPFTIVVAPSVAVADERQLSASEGTELCGTRLWLQSLPFPDRDADGVADTLDNCVDAFNPSQLDGDRDCTGDACQGGREPFVREGLCEERPLITLEPDVPVRIDVALTPCSQVACLRFTTSTPRAMLISAEPLNSEQDIAIFGRWDAFPTASQFEPFERTSHGSLQTLLIGSGRDGTLFLRIQALRMRESEVTVSVSAEARDLSLATFSPRLGGSGGRVSTLIRGSGFAPDVTRFFLRSKNGQAIALPQQTAVVTADRAELRFRLETPGAVDLPCGHYDLVAEEKPFPPVVLVDAIEVVEPDLAVGFDVELTGPDRHRREVVSRATLEVCNVGTEDLDAPLVRIRSPAATEIRLDGDPEFRSGETVALLIGSEGFAGTIPPGGVSRIPIIFRGLDPSCVRCPVGFAVELLTPLEGESMNWDLLEAPPGMSDAAWQQLWPPLSAELGGTIVEVQRKLGEIATRLTRRGVDASSVTTLIRFAARKALGRPTVAIVGRVRLVGSLEPVAGAVVVAWEGRRHASYGTTDARGTFAIDWLEADRRYSLVVSGYLGETSVQTPKAATEADSGDDNGDPDGEQTLPVEDLLAVELLVEPGGEIIPDPECNTCDLTSLPEDAIVPPREAFTNVERYGTSFVGPKDPNEKDAPDGEGDDGLVGPERIASHPRAESMVYKISFENLPDAGGAASVVEVEDVLPAILDGETVRFLEVRVGDRVVHLDTAGEERASGYREVRSEDFVPVAGGSLEHTYPWFGELWRSRFRVTARRGEGNDPQRITWKIETIETIDGSGQSVDPSSPDYGFLPPNDRSDLKRRGEGHVTFSVFLREEESSEGIVIENDAIIRFNGDPVTTEKVKNVFSLFPVPEPVAFPVPADEPEGARLVPTDTTFSWSAAEHATEYDVYLWRQGKDRPLEANVAGRSKTHWSPEEHLHYETFYHWQVVPKNIRGVAAPEPLPVWTFLTADEPPPCPPLELPAITLDFTPLTDGSPARLDWAPVDKASRYRVILECTDGQDETLADGFAGTSFELPRRCCEPAGLRVEAGSLTCRLIARGSVEIERSEICREVLFVRGNADAHGEITITDGIFLLNYLFVGGPEPPCEDAADADNSDSIDISDAIRLLIFLFLGERAPPSPYPNCGIDPTEDSLDCESFQPCLEA